jgi:hypothetical protein
VKKGTERWKRTWEEGRWRGSEGKGGTLKTSRLGPAILKGIVVGMEDLGWLAQRVCGRGVVMKLKLYGDLSEMDRRSENCYRFRTQHPLMIHLHVSTNTWAATSSSARKYSRYECILQIILLHF